MNSNRQAVAGKDGYFELSETIKAFVDHTCLWNFLYDLVYADGAPNGTFPIATSKKSLG